MTTAIIARDCRQWQNFNVKVRLRHVELTKQEIRDLSKEIGTSDLGQTVLCPSFLTFRLRRRDHREQTFHGRPGRTAASGHGVHQLRVRIHGQMARIEVMPSEFLKLMEDANREKIVSEFKKIGFSYVTLDLQGYRMGSMNETIKTD